MTTPHTQPTEGFTPLDLQQIAVLISMYVLPCGLPVKSALRTLQSAPGTLNNDDFVHLIQEFSDVGLYAFVDDVSGCYAATVVEAWPWQLLLSKAIVGSDLQSLVGLKIT